MFQVFSFDGEAFAVRGATATWIGYCTFLLLSYPLPSFMDLSSTSASCQVCPPATGWLVTVAGVSGLAGWVEQDLAPGSQGEERSPAWILRRKAVTVTVDL